MSDIANNHPLKSFDKSSVLICGTARNVARKIDEFILDTDTAFAGFEKITFLICESFSSDETWEKLLSLKSERDNFHCIQDDQIDEGESRRTVRIASARNRLRETIKENFANYDFVVMMDLDGVNRDLSRKNVESCWQHTMWDGATANQPLRYYDIWALRADSWCETDCWNEYASLRKDMSHKQALKTAVTSKMRSIKTNTPPISVHSAFGGLAIYRMNAFLSSEYVGADTEGKEICEHVPFHKGLTNNGFKIYIMPSLVNLNRTTQISNVLKEFVLKLADAFRNVFSRV
jgi:hypothetical protein